MKDWLFSLETLRPLMEQYSPPDATPDRSGITNYVYDLFSLSLKPSICGEMTFRVDASQRQISCSLKRPAEDDYQYFSEFSYMMEPDFLRLRSWSARTWMALEESPEDAFKLTETDSTGRYDGRSVILESKGQRRQRPLRGTLTSKLALLETIRSNANTENSNTLNFTCLDEYEITLRDHRVQPGEWVEAPGGHTLRPFLHTGDGQIPRTLWVDKKERLPIYVTGTEAAVLRAVNDATAAYPREQFAPTNPKRYDLRKMQISPQFQ